MFFKNLCLSLFFCAMGFVAIAQNTLTGKVIDANSNEPLIGATLVIKGTTTGTTTDFDGNFKFENLGLGELTLSVSYGGYSDFEFKTTIKEGENNATIKLFGSTGYTFDPVEVNALRVDQQLPITHTNLSSDQIEKINLGQDVPFLLKALPSVVVTSDAGAGIGYTGIRVRGSDPSRTNVTINGIPLNDAESQLVYWVNLPDFASSTDEIQMQRGVGASTNGTGAFGATINLSTQKINQEAKGSVGLSVGSFNTLKRNIQASSGLLNDKFVVDARISKITSDGYIDRASSDLTSYFVGASYLGTNSSLQFNLFSGHEQTYQAWYGIDPATVESNRTFNPAGIKPDGTFYENQEDNYGQTHYQLLYNWDVSPGWRLNLNGHYTKGAGYYEEYNIDEDLNDFNLDHIVINDSLTITNSDNISRKWLDNDFYGVTYALVYETGNYQNTLGGAWNRYEGDHFGEVIWSQFMSNGSNNHRYYENDAVKSEFNIYNKTSIRRGKMGYYLDLQYRRVAYEFQGFDDSANIVDTDVSLDFFNPKVGLNYYANAENEFYFFAGYTSREPNRNDYTESRPEDRPEAESLLNLELGHRWSLANLNVETNAYFMNYNNQLVPTGKLNDVGEYIRQNVEKSYRLGLEISAQAQVTNDFAINGNLTLSQNKALDYTEFVDDWDTWQQIELNFEESDLAFAPSVIGNIELGYRIFHKENQTLSASLLNKYVGEQYMDNTSNDLAKLDAYFYNDLRIDYSLANFGAKSINIHLQVNNIFNQLYETNGWTYQYSAGGVQDYFIGLYPQAGRHFMLGMNVNF